MFVPVWTNCLFNMFNYFPEWLHISFTYFASPVMFANSLQSDATGAHSCLQQTQIMIPINAKRGKRRSVPLKRGCASCQFKGMKEGERAPTNIHSCLPWKNALMRILTLTLARPPVCTQTNILPPPHIRETEGGGAKRGWCHLCRQLSWGLR